MRLDAGLDSMEDGYVTEAEQVDQETEIEDMQSCLLYTSWCARCQRTEQHEQRDYGRNDHDGSADSADALIGLLSAYEFGLVFFRDSW